MSPAAATAAIERLEGAGYVERSRTEKDRRRVIVQLTGRSRRIIDEIWTPLVDEAMAELAGYSTEELTLVRDFVRGCRELQVRHVGRVSRRSRGTA